MLRLFKQYYPIRNAIFVLGEGGIIFLSVLIASWVILGQEGVHLELGTVMKTLLITVLCQVCLYYNDLYDLKITDTLMELSVRLLQSLGFASIFMATIYFVFPGVMIHEGIFIVTIAIVILFIISWRMAYNLVLKKGLFNQKVMILGSSDTAQEILEEIRRKKDCGYQVAAVVSKERLPDTFHKQANGFIFKDSYENLTELAEQLQVKKIVVALKQKRKALPIDELLQCRVRGFDILEGNSFYEMLLGKLIVEEINPSWLIFSNGFEKRWARRFIKRTLDLAISLTMLIIFSPLIFVVSIAIKLDSEGPVFFSQERVGQKHKSYKVHKFRSMRMDAEKETGPVWARVDDDRITGVGRFMRKWRIDEIPQLWNVMIGEMSFVGPRPERDHFVRQLTDIIPYYRERFSVKPGLTGWAQVSYGYGASVDDAIEKLNYDLFYIKNMSVLMDIMIVARTVRIVIIGFGR